MKRETTVLEESASFLVFVDLASGDRIFIPKQTSTATIPVAVSMAVSERAVQRAARNIGFARAEDSKSLSAALEAVRDTTPPERSRMARERLGIAREVGLVSELRGLPQLSGILTLESSRMVSTGPGASQRARRRVGINTIVTTGTLVVYEVGSE